MSESLLQDENAALAMYATMLGDDRLILGHRLSEWCGHAPILEEDIALANIALDLLGQAEMFLELAAEIQGDQRGADGLAFLRDVVDFRCCRLVQIENGDFAQTIMRQYLYSCFEELRLQELINSSDKRFSAIAERALKENRYHLRHARSWLVRLGDGTEESAQRTRNAFEYCMRFCDELWYLPEECQKLVGKGVVSDPEPLTTEFRSRLSALCKEARLPEPEFAKVWAYGREGTHLEELGLLLTEMQYLRRAYPDASW